MKKIYILTVLVTGLLCTSCSDFLDKKPLTKPDSATFLSTASAVTNYINGLYMSLPAYATYGMGVLGEEKNSDNILAEVYDKRLNGELQENTGGVIEWQNGYMKLRDVNYFLSYYQIPASQESVDVLSMKGEAYFLRAYWHYYLLTRFGSIPVMDNFWDPQATLPELQIPARDRSAVAKFILDDLETAKELLHPRSKFQGLRICKEAAIIFAMRVALYEGTWEKYHKADKFAAADYKADEFLEKVMSLGTELFGMGLELNTAGVNKEDGYANLFNSKDLSSINEVVFWKKYSIAGALIHSLGANLSGGMVDNLGPAGISQSLVNNYLNSDGSAIDPTDEKFKDFNKTFEGRDARLQATIMHSGCKFRSADQGGGIMNVIEFSAEAAKKKLIRPPFLTESGSSRNLTGYNIRMCIDTTYIKGQSETALPIIRYAEALLAYAEAAEELGQCDDVVLAKTLKPLRERAGVKYKTPTLDGPAFSDFGYSISANLREIRRERRSELALQGYRLDDLMRWGAHKLIVRQRGGGAYLGTDGILYKSFDPKVGGDLKKLSVDANNWLDPLANLLPYGYQFNPERDYLLPIPPSELSLNKALEQTPGWRK